MSPSPDHAPNERKVIFGINEYPTDAFQDAGFTNGNEDIDDKDECDITGECVGVGVEVWVYGAFTVALYWRSCPYVFGHYADLHVVVEVSLHKLFIVDLHVGACMV